MAFIQEKLFESGFNLGAPIFVQGGANGKFAVSANQIAWGTESTFNGETFGNTTAELLTAIENSLENNKLKHFSTLTLANAFLTEENSSAAEGQIITVGEGEDIALYLIKSKTVGETTTLFLEEAGGSTKILSTKEEIVAFCNVSNTGKQFYLNESIKNGETVEYAAGLYVVTGTTAQKLATSSATGDYGSDILALQGAVAGIQGALNTYSTALNTYGAALTTYGTALTTLNSDVNTKDSVAYTANYYSSISLDTAKTYTTNEIAKLKVDKTTVKDENNYVSFTYSQTNGLVTIGDLTVSGLATSAYAESLGGKIDALSGDYEGKSVAYIANDVIAKALVSGGESYNSLQEIASWIANHPQDAAEMNAKISAIESSYVVADNALNERILTLEGAGYVTASVVDGYAKEQWVKDQNYVTASVVNGYATEEWVNNAGYVTASIVEGYATEEWVNNASYVTQAYLSSQSYVQSATLVNYYTKDEVAAELNNYVATNNLDILLDKYLDANDYLTTQEVNALGFAKADNVYTKEEINTTLSSYAKASDITTITNALNNKANSDEVYSKEATHEYVSGIIDDLTYTDEAIAGYYVSAVQQSNGVISVERVALPEYVHPDYSTTYAAYHSTYTLEKLGTEIATNEAVTAAALNKLNEDYTALAGNYATLLASFNELLAKVAVYDKKFGYVAATETEEATFKYDYLRIDDCED